MKWDVLKEGMPPGTALGLTQFSHSDPERIRGGAEAKKLGFFLPGMVHLRSVLEMFWA